MYVFGGFGWYDDFPSASNELFMYNLRLKSWKQLVPGGTKDAPCARFYHMSSVVEEDEKAVGGSMIVFGGCNAEGAVYNDVCLYSFNLNEWKKVKVFLVIVFIILGVFFLF